MTQLSDIKKLKTKLSAGTLLLSLLLILTVAPEIYAAPDEGTGRPTPTTTSQNAISQDSSAVQSSGVPCDKKNISVPERVNCIPRLCDTNKLTAQQLESCKACNKLHPTLKECLQKNTIVKQLNIIVNFLSALVGIVIVGSLIWAGIQYTLGGDNSKQVTDAKQRIINTFIALIGFMFIAAFLQWLIPGGLFN